MSGHNPNALWYSTSRDAYASSFARNLNDFYLSKRMPKAKPIPMDAAHSLPFDEIMRRALMLKPTKPKKASRPKGAKKKGK